jgi:hypothetical protein
VKAPRLRFSLSILFAAMALAAIPLAWRANAVSRQNRAIASIQASGIDVTFFDGSGEETSRLDFFSGDDVVEAVISGQWLEDPASLPSSVLLSLNGLTSLEHLQIIGFDLTSHNVASLDGSKTLKEFQWVVDPEIKSERVAEVVAALAWRYPNLESVTLCGLPASDDDLLPLADLTRLKSLRLIDGSFDGSFLSTFGTATLEEVDLISERFSPEAFAELARFRRLRYVDVCGGGKLPASSLDAAIELDFVETLRFCIEPGPLPRDKEKALTERNSPAIYEGFQDLAKTSLFATEEGWIYRRLPK